MKRRIIMLAPNGIKFIIDSKTTASNLDLIKDKNLQNITLN